MTTETKWIPLPTLQAVAKAQADDFVIERRAHETYVWQHWKECVWDADWQFRGRPRQPKMKEVKMECFLIDRELRWRDEGLSILGDWIRQPILDLVAKVPE